MFYQVNFFPLPIFFRGPGKFFQQIQASVRRFHHDVLPRLDFVQGADIVHRQVQEMLDLALDSLAAGIADT